MRMKYAVALVALSAVLALCMTTSVLAKPRYAFGKDVIEVKDHKSWKKLTKQKSKILLISYGDISKIKKYVKPISDAAAKLVGVGTVAHLNCKEQKQTCKRLKLSHAPAMRYYGRGGKFVKDYDRKQDRVDSYVAFLTDPEAEPDWSEEDSDIKIIDNNNIEAFLSAGGPSILTIYAPWCGHCKKLKPDYVTASTTAKNKGWTLAACDGNSPKGRRVSQRFNVTGFPTSFYLKDGAPQYKIKIHNEQDILTFISDPQPPPPPPPPEKAWSDSDSQVVHLTKDTFSAQIEKPTLVMFYAPWCGHCKAMKPHMDTVAKEVTAETPTIAALDCTLYQGICKKYEVTGYPTVLFFKNGENEFKFTGRSEDDIRGFIKDPKPPPPPPPPEPAWSEVESAVVHPESRSAFDKLIKKPTLVMFYAPWCGHCKAAKPHYQIAADKAREEGLRFKFAGIDCTDAVHRDLCTENEVKGYPTILFFNKKEAQFKYAGGRDEDGFLKFARDPKAPPPPPPPEPEWSEAAPEVKHLTDDTFSEAYEHPTLVMFYAPWCGHCKALKPDYAKVAAEVNTDSSKPNVAGIDCTKHQAACKKYDIKGYPTLLFFKGENDYFKASVRNYDAITSFLKDPQAPPPPPPPEPAWNTLSTDIVHFENEDQLKNHIDHHAALVMFYAPWCGHCKKLKPDFQEAATKLKKTHPGSLAAVDCTLPGARTMCQDYEVQGYPTLIYLTFPSPNNAFKYESGRNTQAIIDFIKEKIPAQTGDQQKQDL